MITANDNRANAGANDGSIAGSTSLVLSAINSLDNSTFYVKNDVKHNMWT